MLRTRENSDVFNSHDEIYLVFTSKKQISSIYSGDDELDRLEKEILKKWGLLEIPVLNMSMQDEKKALKEFQGALQYRMAGNDEQVREKLQVF